MINLKEHVVIRQDIEYVPLEIAEAAVKEAVEQIGYLNNIKAIDNAMEDIKNSMKQFNTSLENLDKDD